MSQLEAGDVLARRYLLLEPLARGGMSVIWRAFDQSLHRLVAVKVLTASLHLDLGERFRVRSEARAAARFLHRDSIEIYDYGESVTTKGGVAAYVVMPLLDGTPLAERVAEGPLPWTEAAMIALRLARVLMAGHAHGLVHRDVTAENVLLTADGPKLLDFGIAAWTGDPEDDRGTPPYVAPERLAGAPTHPAVDVYALGVLLHTMITGRTPYPETTWEEIEAARRTGPPPRVPGVPHAVASLCQDCLAPDPVDRPTAAEIVAALTGALAATYGGRRVRRRLAAAGSAALALSALLWLRYEGDAAVPGPGATTAAQGTVSPSSPPTAAQGAPTPSDPPTTTQSVPTPSGPPTTTQSVPTPSASPAAVGTAGTPGPRATSGSGSTASSPGSRPAVRQAVQQAVAEFHAALDSRTPCGTTDADVVLDLKQVLRGAMAPPHGPSEARASGPEAVEGVRRKLDDRLREGRLEPACLTELQARLDAIASALTTS
uniref:serine/threonine-protein kinase n=1 Tax=Nonomuraea pusilla TaxID=46177 RepID=UPI0006E384C7|nr:serine/threonine-protein kinase [Nonomuraea pusilla]